MTDKQPESDHEIAEKVRNNWWHRNQSGIVGFLCGAVLALVLLCAYFVKANHDTIAKIEDESTQRRDQSCRGWEKAHAQEIKELKRSYAFYRDPSPALKPLLDNPISLIVLRERVRNAQSDQDQFGQFVPKYCDEPGVGVKEPDPKVPKTPPRITRLLEQAQQQVEEARQEK